MNKHLVQGALAAITLSASLCAAQTTPQNAPPSLQAPQPSSAASASEAPRFPPVMPSNFSAATPTKEQVEGFLKTSWGYDTNRVWEVYSIQKTAAPGVSKVQVLLAEKPNVKQLASLVFFVTPDGKHLITQDTALDFGPHPYENNYRMLQERANGPSRGAQSKQFELVEFADFQCPHCKEAQPIVDKLVKDFPQARYIFQFFPLVNIHPEAFQSAVYGECVKQQGGNDAFFKYADAVFNNQEALDGQGAVQALKSAVTAAGQDPAKVATCADSAEAKAAVHASMQLGADLNVDQTPMLLIDGRAVPMLAVPYDQLKKIIEWQFSLDKGSGQPNQ